MGKELEEEKVRLEGWLATTTEQASNRKQEITDGERLDLVPGYKMLRNTFYLTNFLWYRVHVELLYIEIDGWMYLNLYVFEFKKK